MSSAGEELEFMCLFVSYKMYLSSRSNENVEGGMEGWPDRLSNPEQRSFLAGHSRFTLAIVVD